MGEEDCNNKHVESISVNSYIVNKNMEENKEQEFYECYDNMIDKNFKIKASLENGEEIQKLNKYYNSKLTEIKPPILKKVEDIPIEPEVKQKLIKSLISDINI